MIQQGQVFKLKTRGADGRPLWAYRYRLDGRSSARPQVGGFATRAEAEEVLRKTLARLRPGGCAATMTLTDLVEEYLGVHQAAPVTIAKLRRLLGKATSVLGPVRLADLSPKDVYAWRQSWWLLLVLAALTYLSRAAGLALLPAPPERVERLLARIPAPLFAGFVALSLVDPDRSAASVPVLGATAGALLVAPSRSFPIVLAGGIAGYAVVAALT